MTAAAYYTVGHSTRTIEAFVKLLRTADVGCVVDVRSVPRSRTNPQYNRDSLPASLAPYGIDYTHIAELGGLRGKSREVPGHVNAYWQNQSFHNYADYTHSVAFDQGFERLLELGTRHVCTIMCSEAVWWRCHRRILTDYLLQHGEQVYHLMGAARIDPARQTAAVTPIGTGKLAYPAREVPEL
ncbi:MAG: DUF488 family protein [Gammaproteobacteria bacterium]